MNTGQMMLASLALVLLGSTVIAVNRSFGGHGQVLQNTEIGIYAISLATSLVEEASGQNFDENTVDDAITSVSSLTTASGLGTDSGEPTSGSTVGFDDFDDYDGLIMGIAIAGVDSFTVESSVNYVNGSSPETITTSRTFHKRIDVMVHSLATTDTIRMSYVFSYFNFR